MQNLILHIHHKTTVIDINLPFRHDCVWFACIKAGQSPEMSNTRMTF